MAEATALATPPNRGVAGRHLAAQPDLARRRWLIGGAGALVQAGCATFGDADDRIFKLGTGQELSAQDLAAVLRRTDRVLLGERHDNPLHHQRRGAFIASLGITAVVVAEHLPRGARASYGADVLDRLLAAGFDAKAWQWPAHQGLFGPVLAAGQMLVGGNLPRAVARQIGREGAAAVPEELREWIESAPLSANAQAALDRDLINGHCGQLERTRLISLRMAQRARDASMALAMKGAGGRPSVLVAGNGHVRKDHGVPVILRRLAPLDSVVSVGFAEHGSPSTELPYDYVWITRGMSRIDPCKDFVMPSTTAATPRR